MGVLFDTWKGTKLAQVPGLLRGEGWEGGKEKKKEKHNVKIASHIRSIKSKCIKLQLSYFNFLN